MHVTVFVFLACLVAATGGLIFGYNIGIFGGITLTESFMEEFFPSMHQKMKSNQNRNKYCKYDNQLLTMFMSSMYIAALVASFVAATVTRVFGRRWSMVGGGVTVLVGVCFTGAAKNVIDLFVGRIFLGIGVGFTNQSVPLYLSEMAPSHLRGGINMGFQLMVTIGILTANLVNYGTAKIGGGWGWRVSLALAAVPAAILTIGSLFLPDTPNSLVDRGYPEQARATLRSIRGTSDVEEEYTDLLAASEASKLVAHPWITITKCKYRPQLMMAILIPMFQQLTSINVIMLFAPIIFQIIGFKNDASLFSAVIIGLINVMATIVFVFFVDRSGRRPLFLEGGIQMIISQVLVGTLIGVKFGATGESHISKSYASLVLILICVYVAGFAWSWDALGWLIPSEIFPLEVRSAGQSINVFMNKLFTIIIAHASPPMLCHMEFGLFYFYAGWVVVMTVFIFFFLPETKNVSIDRMEFVWKNH